VYDFAVGAQQEPQHAVRTGVLRAHVDEHFVSTDVELNNAGIFDDGGHECQFPGVQNSV
jgi:hypothetical protein